MNIEQYEKFRERVGEHPAPCRYGHFDCSDRDGGRCSDEEAPREDLTPSKKELSYHWARHAREGAEYSARADVSVENHGSLVLLRPRSEAGRDWLHENIPHAHWFGEAAAVEPRYAAQIVEGITGDGLEVA